MTILLANLKGRVAFACLLLACSGTAGAAQRGELLYDTHCITCHSSKMHWREQRVVTDWPGLKAEVRRWQAAVSLTWNDADIAEVARYLNQTAYHFDVDAAPAPGTGAAASGSSPRP